MWRWSENGKIKRGGRGKREREEKRGRQKNRGVGELGGRERKRERNALEVCIKRSESHAASGERFPHLCVQNDDDLCHEGNGGGKGWRRGCECTERRRAAGPMVVVPCINHPSARHSHSQAPKPTPRVARASVVLDHPFCVSCAVHTRSHIYIHTLGIVLQTQIHTPEAHKLRLE